MKIDIENANVEDMEFIVKANAEIDRCSYIESSKLKENIYEDLFKANKAICLLAKNDGKNIGMVLFSKVYWADRGEGIYISQIFVEESFRNKGVFKLLVKNALNFYQNTNFVTCLVAKRNGNMINCMHKLNFEDEDMISYAKNKEDLEKIF